MRAPGVASLSLAVAACDGVAEKSFSAASRARVRVRESQILPALPRPLHIPLPIGCRVSRSTFTALPRHSSVCRNPSSGRSK